MPHDDGYLYEFESLDDDMPVPIVSDERLLDWAPGSQPLFRRETPAEMRRRQAGWPKWRRKIAQALGLLA